MQQYQSNTQMLICELPGICTLSVVMILFCCMVEQTVTVIMLWKNVIWNWIDLGDVYLQKSTWFYVLRFSKLHSKTHSSYVYFCIHRNLYIAIKVFVLNFWFARKGMPPKAQLRGWLLSVNWSSRHRSILSECYKGAASLYIQPKFYMCLKKFLQIATMFTLAPKIFLSLRCVCKQFYWRYSIGSIAIL